jgi:hypothetical protein
MKHHTAQWYLRQSAFAPTSTSAAAGTVLLVGEKAK